MSARNIRVYLRYEYIVELNIETIVLWKFLEIIALESNQYLGLADMDEIVSGSICNASPVYDMSYLFKPSHIELTH